MISDEFTKPKKQNEINFILLFILTYFTIRRLSFNSLHTHPFPVKSIRINSGYFQAFRYSIKQVSFIFIKNT